MSVRPRTGVAAAVAPSERDFTAMVIDLAHVLGWRCAHFRPAETRHGWRTPVQGDGAGFPDLVLVKQRVIVAELKAGRGKATDEQAAWLAAFESAGVAAFVWRPSDFDAIVEELRR